MELILYFLFKHIRNELLKNTFYGKMNDVVKYKLFPFLEIEDLINITLTCKKFYNFRKDKHVKNLWCKKLLTPIIKNKIEYHLHQKTKPWLFYYPQKYERDIMSIDHIKIENYTGHTLFDAYSRANDDIYFKRGLTQKSLEMGHERNFYYVEETLIESSNNIKISGVLIESIYFDDYYDINFKINNVVVHKGKIKELKFKEALCNSVICFSELYINSETFINKCYIKKIFINLERVHGLFEYTNEDIISGLYVKPFEENEKHVADIKVKHGLVTYEIV